jgi:hypothetical protein
MSLKSGLRELIQTANEEALSSHLDDQKHSIHTQDDLDHPINPA